MRRPGKKERQETILNEIRTSAGIRISALAAHLGVSGETIRRDLSELDKARLLNRTYGGATLAPFAVEPSIAERSVTLIEERRRIGRLAATRVAPRQVVMIDGGSTTYHATRALTQSGRDLTIITNSTAIASVAGTNPSFRVILCPGVYDRRESSAFGEDTVEFLARFTAHVAVIGASGLTLDGPREAVPGGAAVKRAMIHGAGKTVLVIDRSKFGLQAIELVCPFERIAEIVTDGEPPSDIGAAMLKSGTRLNIA